MSTRKTYRLGTTAIAAVLALSATQVAAQEAPATEAPVIETPTVTTTAPTTTEPVTTVDPLAPAAEPEVTTSDTESAASTAEPTEAAPAKTVAKKSAPKPAPSTRVSSVRTPAVTAVDEPAEIAAAPVPAAPAPEPVAEPSAQVADATAADKPNLDEAVPLAGGAGAVILALAGAGMAVRRRKRREDEEEFEQSWTEERAVEADVAQEPEPVWDPPIVEPKAAPVIATTEVSDDFDTSKFGRHVQAAYAGPTPENPSLSLRKRLKIAGELDRRERLNGNVPAGPATLPRAEAPQSKNFMFSGAPSHQKQPEPQF
ncbi:hypothetical protein [Sphingomonas daechungensis]